MSDFDNQFSDAVAAGRRAREHAPYAVRAQFDAKQRRVVVDLNNGTQFAVPVDLVQGLGAARDEQLHRIELSPAGTGLHWPALDADASVAGLLAGIYGTRGWVAALTSYAGRQPSAAKAAAARRNGRLGGRPSKRLAIAAAKRTATTHAVKKVAKKAMKKAASKRSLVGKAASKAKAPLRKKPAAKKK